MSYSFQQTSVLSGGTNCVMMTMLRCGTLMNNTDCGGRHQIVLVSWMTFWNLLTTIPLPMVVEQIADSRCSTFYFIPKFRRIKPPKPDEKDFDERCLAAWWMNSIALKTVKGNLLLGPMLFNNASTESSTHPFWWKLERVAAVVHSVDLL